MFFNRAKPGQTWGNVNPLVEALEGRQFLSAAPLAAPAGPAGGATAAVTAAQSVGGVRLVEVVGKSFTARLGTFRLNNLDTIFKATINWGDGKTSTGRIASPTVQEHNVFGTHTYARTGTYRVRVTITASPVGPDGGIVPAPPGVLASFDSTIVVKPAVGVRLTQTAGKRFSARIGTFFRNNVDTIFKATIDWGDGKKSTGRIISPTVQLHNVYGSHTYARAGTYSVKVTITASSVGPDGGIVPAPPGVLASFISTIVVKRAG